jgi:electron transfer flavoprotein beta subunit
MQILVCISSVPDTTTRPAFSADGSRLETAGIQWIVNPWDELALTRALELKETAGSGITAVDVAGVGNQSTEAVLRKALAIGADKAFRVDFEPLDSWQAASQLAGLLRNEPHDLIIVGIDSSDYNGSAVGPMLSELLDLPSISAVSGIELQEGAFLIKREVDGGSESLSAPLPLVLVVQKGIAREPRIPSMRGVMGARTKPLQVIAPSAVTARAGMSAFQPPPRRGDCKKVDPENMPELVRLLHQEAKVI